MPRSEMVIIEDIRQTKRDIDAATSRVDAANAEYDEAMRVLGEFSARSKDLFEELRVAIWTDASKS